jgi:hypothetical protein
MAAANMLRLITCYDQGTQPNGLVSIHPNHGAAQGNRNSNTRLKKGLAIPPPSLNLTLLLLYYE